MLLTLGFIANSFGATQTINVNLTTSSPTFTRPLSGNPPSSLSTQTGCYYSVFAFTAPVSGTYTITAVGSVDNFGALYQNSFIPSSPLVNIMRSNDDWNPTDPTNKNYGFSKALVAGVTYYLVSTMFYGATTGNYQVNISGPFTTALPVELSSFSANLLQDEVMLNWTTSSEHNCDGFSVEKSLDGKTFTRLAFVKSQASNGNSSEKLNYQFNDNTPAALNYYRIAMLDLDGKTTYSQTVLVDVNAVANQVNTFPNPVSNQLNVQFYTAKVSKTEVRLSDMLGRTVYSSNNNSIMGNNQLSIDMSGMNNGMYILNTILNGKTLQAATILKQ